MAADHQTVVDTENLIEYANTEIQNVIDAFKGAHHAARSSSIPSFEGTADVDSVPMGPLVGTDESGLSLTTKPKDSDSTSADDIKGALLEGHATSGAHLKEIDVFRWQVVEVLKHNEHASKRTQVTLRGAAKEFVDHDASLGAAIKDAGYDIDGYDYTKDHKPAGLD